jgi:hypothetical protein
VTFAFQPDPASVVVVCGVRGSGKSYSTARYCDRIPRVVVWDPLDEYSAALGLERLSLAQFCFRAGRGDFRRGLVRVSVAPPGVKRDAKGKVSWDLAAAFDEWCLAVESIGNVCAVVEEVSLVASPSSVPDAFKRLLSVGRHRAVSLVVVGQRFAQHPRLSTAMASEVRAFRQTEPSDLGDLDKRLGPSADGVTPSTVARSLQRGSCITWTPDNGWSVSRPPAAQEQQ